MYGLRILKVRGNTIFYILVLTTLIIIYVKLPRNFRYKTEHMKSSRESYLQG